MLCSYIIRFMLVDVDFTLVRRTQTPVLIMASKTTLIFIAAFAVLNFASALPDSAGIVEMTNGLAYGGIPYGSVSGMVANYGQQKARQIPSYAAQNIQQRPALVLAQTSTRSVNLVPRVPGAGSAVQIFSHPGVVAPGVVGMIHQVGYQ